MKCYNWVNSYTVGGQNDAIQIAHAQIGMCKNFISNKSVLDWMDDKTTVVLKGGNHKALTDLADFLSKGNLPWYSFCESQDALNGAMTNVCCLPTDEIVNAAFAVRKYGKSSFIIDDGKLSAVKAGETGTEFYRFHDQDLKVAGCSVLVEWEKDGKYEWITRKELILRKRKNEIKTFSRWETELIFIIADSRLA